MGEWCSRRKESAGMQFLTLAFQNHSLLTYYQWLLHQFQFIIHSVTRQSPVFFSISTLRTIKSVKNNLRWQRGRHIRSPWDQWALFIHFAFLSLTTLQSFPSPNFPFYLNLSRYVCLTSPPFSLLPLLTPTLLSSFLSSSTFSLSLIHLYIWIIVIYF